MIHTTKLYTSLILLTSTIFSPALAVEPTIVANNHNAEKEQETIQDLTEEICGEIHGLDSETIIDLKQEVLRIACEPYHYATNTTKCKNHLISLWNKNQSSLYCKKNRDDIEDLRQDRQHIFKAALDTAKQGFVFSEFLLKFSKPQGHSINFNYYEINADGKC